ncbi:hypothetical protein KR52_07640 [Synechococcus sp. KORDI-52]|nr:hypothetical protein KR52_07640 [Synechococcus sp. KORDI-52]
MNDETKQSRRTLLIWALVLNLIAWGAYFYLTKVMGFDIESIRQARMTG